MPSLGCILQLRLAGKSPDSLVSYTSGLKCLKRRELGDEQLLQGSVCELVLPGILTALLESKILMWSKAEGEEQTTSKDHCFFFPLILQRYFKHSHLYNGSSISVFSVFATHISHTSFKILPPSSFRSDAYTVLLLLSERHVPLQN